MTCEEVEMPTTLRKLGIITATICAITSGAIALPGAANAQHHHGGGHWGGHGGGWGGFGLGLGTGLAVGAAPYYGGYYGYGPYAYDDGAYAYAGDCYLKRRWVVDEYGRRILRRMRVCY
jgi:hypothetical protein